MQITFLAAFSENMPKIIRKSFFYDKKGTKEFVSEKKKVLKHPLLMAPTENIVNVSS